MAKVLKISINSSNAMEDREHRKLMELISRVEADAAPQANEPTVLKPSVNKAK